MRPRVVVFAALCAAAVAAILWFALGGEEEAPPARAERKHAIVARQVEPAPPIGAEQRAPAPAPAPEPTASFEPDDAPVIEVLDILEAIARSTE
jgi:hypothetical protein